jgi:hypothetical protein
MSQSNLHNVAIPVPVPKFENIDSDITVSNNELRVTKSANSSHRFAISEIIPQNALSK